MNSRSLFFLMVLTLTSINTMRLAATPWATPVLESTPNTDESQIAIHPEGNMVVISTIEYGLNHVIEAKTYRHSTNSWSEPKYLSTFDMDAHNPRITVDPEGNAVVIWQITDGIQERLQAAIYTSSTDSWSSTKNLSKMTSNISVTHVGMSESGNVFIGWKKSNPDKEIFKSVTFSQALEKWSRPNTQILSQKEPEQSQLSEELSKKTVLLAEQLVKMMRTPEKCNCKEINPLISLICQTDSQGTTCSIQEHLCEDSCPVHGVSNKVSVK